MLAFLRPMLVGRKLNLTKDVKQLFHNISHHKSFMYNNLIELHVITHAFFDTNNCDEIQTHIKLNPLDACKCKDQNHMPRYGKDK